MDMTTESVVNEARERSKEVVNKYLMNQAQDDYAPHASLINMKKVKKLKKKKKKHGHEMSDSDSVLKRRKHKKKKKKRLKEGYKSETSTASESDVDGEEPYGRSGSPVYFLLTELRKVAPEGKAPRSYPALKLNDLFDEWTDERKMAYDKDAIKAIRERNIPQLRVWNNSGRTLQAANDFGESLLHLACRRGFLDVVTFLVKEAGVNLWIRDDTGRTPLHDACWTPKPCFELVDFIIGMDRDMLYVSDKRGHTPLDYARKENWDKWIDHFEERAIEELLPVRDCFYLDTKKTVPNKVASESAILENVDDMIGQLEISTPKPKLERRHSGGNVEDAGAVSDGDHSVHSSHSATNDNRSFHSYGSRSSRHRAHRRRRRQQNGNDDHDDDDDDDDDSIHSGSRRSHRSHRSHRSNRDPNSWKVVDVKVVHEA